jgi:O-antigen/teichoic acid export membrane protein
LFVDEAAQSAATFLSLAVVARVLDVESVGIVALAVSLGGLGQFLLTSTILQAGVARLKLDSPEDQRRGIAAINTLHTPLVAGLALLAAVGAIALPAVRPALLTIAFTLPFGLYHDKSRRILHRLGRNALATWATLTRFGLQAMGFVLLAVLGFLTLPTALLLLFAPAGLPALFMHRAIRDSVARRPRQVDSRAAVEALRRHVPWGATAGFAGWSTTQLYGIIALGLVGVEAYGLFAVAFSLHGLTRPVLRGATNFWIQRLPRPRSRPGSSLGRSMRNTTLGALAMSLGYIVSVAAGSRWIVPAVYGVDFAESARLWTILSIALIPQALHALLTASAWLAGRSSAIAVASIVSGVSALLVAVPLITVLSLVGAAIGVTISTTIGLIVLAAMIRRPDSG